MNKIKTIGVATPGGDAPGMNTAIRAVVRTAMHHGLKVWGIQKGWYGLIHGNLIEMDTKSVSGIINEGGTILHTRRCPEFADKKNKDRAFQNLVERSIDGIVVIGGDGSMRASQAFMKEYHVPINVVPASIDNDIPCTDFTIGFDTAVNTAMDAIDKIRDTATSHERIFVVEVMGRNNGYIALDVGLVCGAEEIIIPEVKYNLNNIIDKIIAAGKRGKESYIIVMAEGAGDSRELVNALQKRLPMVEVRLTVLGYVQRGGRPSAFSRELACKLGAAAVEQLVKGNAGNLVCAISDKIRLTPFKKVVATKKKIDQEQLTIAHILAS